MGLSTASGDATVVSIDPHSAGGLGHDAPRLPRQLGPRELAVADAVRHRLLRDRVHGDRGEQVRPRALRHGAHELLAAPGRRADLRRPRAVQARAGASAASGSRCRSPSGASRWAPARRRGGMFDNYAVVQGIDTIIPVDVYVPAARRARKALMYGIMMLQKKVMQRAHGRQVRSATRWSPIRRASSTSRPSVIDELSEPFGNSVHQTRSGL